MLGEDSVVNTRVLRSRKNHVLLDISNNNGNTKSTIKSTQPPVISMERPRASSDPTKRKRECINREIQMLAGWDTSIPYSEDAVDQSHPRRSRRLSNRSSDASSMDISLTSVQTIQAVQISSPIEQDIPLLPPIFHASPESCTYMVDLMYEHYREVEEQFYPSPYMHLQQDVTARMRVVLVDWIVDLHLKFHLHQSTLWLCVSLFDRYLSIAHSHVRTEVQLVGVTCFLIASKFEDIYPPTLEELVDSTDNSCSREDILRTEEKVLTVLEYQLVVPTAYHFLMKLLNDANANEALRFMTFYLAERSLQEYDSLTDKPSTFAAGCMYAALRQQRHLKSNLSEESVWSEAMVRSSGGLLEADLLPVARRVVQHARELHRTSKRILEAAKVKYRTDKFLRTSALPLPDL